MSHMSPYQCHLSSSFQDLARVSVQAEMQAQSAKAKKVRAAVLRAWKARAQRDNVDLCSELELPGRQT